MIQSQPSHTENKAPIHNRQPRLYSALHLVTRLAVQSPVPRQSRRSSRLRAREQPPQQGHRPKQPVAFLSTMSNSKSPTPQRKARSAHATTPDLFRSSQHGSLFARASRSSPSQHHQAELSPAPLQPMSDRLGLIVGSGGANRDRTGDLLLAKQALSQLSYGPGTHQPDYSPARLLARSAPARQRPCCAKEWWAREDLNFRPHAYQARALTS